MSIAGAKARSIFKDGHNCSQSVLLAFSDEFNIDPDTLLNLASSFGGGMGRLREVCGAVSGMFMVVGLKYGYSDPKDYNAKSTHYKLIQYLAKEFKRQNGSIICRELLKERKDQNTFVPEKRTETYYQTRSCPDMVEMAAAIVEKIMNVTGKIAIACDNGVISPELENCTQFLVFSISGNVIVKCETVTCDLNENIADFLSGLNVDSVVSGSIKDTSAFNKKGIKTITQAKGVPYMFLQSNVVNAK
ncbi:MAG: C-GCAxxG-C-C family (seleno)protein [Eubacteriales bacterium]